MAVRLFFAAFVAFAWVLGIGMSTAMPGAWLNDKRAHVADYSKVQLGPVRQSVRLDDGVVGALDRPCGILTVSRHGRRLWRGDLSSIRPWKLVAADVDGGGHREMALGVYKSTRYFPYPHPGLFVYRWGGNGIVPVWRGSNLGEPFVDFAFLPKPNGPAELIAVEVQQNGCRCVAGYHWSHFGFVGDWRHGNWERLKILSTRGGQLSILADGRKLFVSKDGNVH